MGLVVIDLITSPVVAGGGVKHPPSTAAQLSFFAQPRSWEDLSLRGGLLLSSARIVYVWWMDLDFFLGHIL